MPQPQTLLLTKAAWLQQPHHGRRWQATPRLKDDSFASFTSFLHRADCNPHES